MKRSAVRIGLFAVIVESLGGLALLMLLFPASPHPVREVTNSPPTLRVPAPTLERDAKGDSGRAVAGRETETSQFVARELEVSRRALVMLFDKHVQQLFEPLQAAPGRIESP